MTRPLSDILVAERITPALEPWRSSAPERWAFSWGAALYPDTDPVPTTASVLRATFACGAMSRAVPVRVFFNESRRLVHPTKSIDAQRVGAARATGFEDGRIIGILHFDRTPIGEAAAELVETSRRAWLADPRVERVRFSAVGWPAQSGRDPECYSIVRALDLARQVADDTTLAPLGDA